MYGLNFGDLLTPTLIETYGHIPKFNPVATKSSLVSVGSILELVEQNYTGTILGSGCILPTTKKQYKNANVVSVRGELTKQLLGITKDILLGDPGLLCEDILKNRETKEYVLGLVPHYQDKSSPVVNTLVNKYRQQIKVIDVQQTPEKVLRDMDKCENILSSSLHGLICADALNIPNKWITLLNLLKGGPFKFNDYYSIFGVVQTPLKLTENYTIDELVSMTIVPPRTITEIKTKIKESFITTLETL